MFSLLHSVANEEHYKISSAATIENLDSSYYNYREAVKRYYCKSTPSIVNKDKWDTARTQVITSMKYALYILQYAKGTCQVAIMKDNGNIKPVALAIIELHFTEGITR